MEIRRVLFLPASEVVPLSPVVEGLEAFVMGFPPVKMGGL